MMITDQVKTMTTTKLKKAKTLITIVGPTAIGKTALAISIAKAYQTEIVSADSRQFFKEMEIGTAKPSFEELNQAPHHFINSHSIHTLFSTGDFEEQALKLLDELFLKHDVVVLVGGSGLYIDALIKGLDNLPEIDLNVREKLNELLQTEGITSIQSQLSKFDPEYFSKVDQNNPQRMIRGLEMYLSTGIKLSELLTNQVKERPFNIIKIGLNTERTLLYERINLRVDQMMNAGLLEEVKSLYPLKHLNALQTVGYTELFDYIEGKLSLPEAVDKIKQNTRRFAKRQLTWFRRDPDTIWFEPQPTDKILDYLGESLKLRQ